MKIGIVTIHRSKNYGAELQAYAMQTFLQQQGFEAGVVDYWPQYRQETEKLLSKSQLKVLPWKQRIQLLIQAPLVYRRFHKRWKSTKRFINQYLCLSKDNNYDVVVYGSDQIWRKMNYPKFKGYDPVFFGDDSIAAKKRISYAASMGKVTFANEKDEDSFIALLNNFDAISVRETDLKSYLDSKLGKDVPTVCDPVFLLDKGQWESFIDDSIIPSYPYIFYYNHQELTTTTSFTNFLHNVTHLPVIEMRGQVPPFHYNKRYRLTGDAREFVSLLSGAAYVVTSSFHGVALSICLEKQFYCASRQRRANRIESLLQSLHLQGRKIEGEYDKIYRNAPIDYKSVQQDLFTIVEKSKCWLNSQIEENE